MAMEGDSTPWGPGVLQKLEEIAQAMERGTSKSDFDYRQPDIRPHLVQGHPQMGYMAWVYSRGDGPVRQIGFHLVSGIERVELSCTETNSPTNSNADGPYTGSAEQIRDAWLWLHFNTPLSADSLPKPAKK